MTYEIQIRDRFEYVAARSEAEALKKVRTRMTPIERHFVQPLPTGRNR